MPLNFVSIDSLSHYLRPIAPCIDCLSERNHPGFPLNFTLKITVERSFIEFIYLTEIFEYRLNENQDSFRMRVNLMEPE